MAESAVTFLLNHLTPLVREELKLSGGIREDAEHIIDELEHMRAFLRVADAMEDSDLELQVWVKQVREVAYDTEDVVDEFMLRLEHHHGDGFYGFLGKICFSIKKWKARYRIASEMRRIQSRVTKICEGHQRYRYKFNISEQGSSSTSTSAVNNTWYESRGDALLLEEGELVGIEKPKQQLIGWLIDGDSRLKLASVVGMGGLGKTTLVKRVYDDAGVKKHFHNHAWITVSQSFKIEELLKDTIQQLFDEIKQPVPQGVETMNSNRLKATINEFLQQRRYVLVFDDIWNIGAWEAVKYALPNSNCGSRVILTTRMVDVASASCVETDGYIYPLKPLSQEESWTLFCKKTFRGSSCPRHLMEISQSILNRCEGLPLAIVAVAGVLATKNTTRIDEWEMLRRSLGAELEGNDKLENMRKILLLSFNDLPYYLKLVSCT